MRGGRFGRREVVINFVLQVQSKFIKKIEQHYGIQIVELPDDLEEFQ